MKQILVLSIAAIASLFMAASAQATGETVTGTTHITSLKGPLYQTAPRPVDLTMRAEVSTPDSATTVLPMKRTTFTFPQGLTLHPDNKVTPPCTDQKLNEQSALSNASAIVSSCAKSVVGTGTAAIYIGKMKSVPITDPILVVFNAGKDSQGRAKLKIYGYSKYTNVGILMSGTLKGRVLDVAIPMLSADSAVQYFQLEMPGPTLSRPDIGINVKGRDANYAEATCPSANGVWATNSVFELGERDPSTGTPVGGTTTINSPQTTQNCTGLPGKAKLKVVKVKGPKAVKRGKKGVFRITIKDPGTATAKNVVVRGPGAKRKVGNIAVGRTKTVKVKAKVKGRKGSRAKVKFVVTGKGAKTTKVIRVKVK